MCGFYVEREDMYEKNEKIQKNLLKISFQQNFKFSKSVEWFKSYTFFPSIYKKKKFKNEQKVYWLEEDYMEMKMIVVRNQSRIISTWPLKLAHCAPPPNKTSIKHFLFNKKVSLFCFIFIFDIFHVLVQSSVPGK